MKLDIRADVRDVERALDRLPKLTGRAVTRAMNYAIRKAQTEAARAITRDVPGIKQRRVRDAMRLKLARANQWTAAVSARGARIPIIDLAARQTQRGVTYRTKQGRRLIPGAFLATMRSGHRGAFKRAGKRRLPIQELHGPSIPRVFIQRHIEAEIDRAAQAAWGKEIARQMELARTQSGLK